MTASTPLTFVIGAAGGIGSALCGQLAVAGHRLVIAGRDLSRLDELAASLDGAVTATHALDAGDFDAVEAALAAQDPPTGAVNLAGSILLKPAHTLTAHDFDAAVHQNVRTAMALARAAGRTMRDRGGSVVLMSSCAASVGLPNHEGISMAKAAVEGLARSAAATYAGAGLRFNAVAPGLTDTPLAAPITRNASSLETSRAMHPLGRIGDPKEVARLIAFLLDPDNGWITGQVLGVDGGVSRIRSRS